MSTKKENIITMEFDPANPPPLTDEEKFLMQKLADMPDSEIDYSDIPPISSLDGFRRANLLPDLVRIDRDILAWVRTLGEDREVAINRMLRKHMQAQSMS